MTYDRHGLNRVRVPIDAVEDAINAAHAATVTGPDMINALVKKWLPGKLLEVIKECAEVFVGPQFAVLSKPASMNVP